jgi:hypothetical protein
LKNFLYNHLIFFPIKKYQMGVCLITGMLIASKGGCLRAPSEWKKEEEKKMD